MGGCGKKKIGGTVTGVSVAAHLVSVQLQIYLRKNTKQSGQVICVIGWTGDLFFNILSAAG